MNQSQTNVRLGYPPDTRLLIINADDFGMCHAVNQAVMRALPAGVVTSTTLMVPCPWALHAMHFLRDHPEIPFGVHLTVISDWADYRWGPVTPRDQVASLITPAGHFHNFEQMPAFLAQLELNQLELEFRAQIEVVLGAGLKPTHLDWHALRLGGRADIMELMFNLARDYGLAIRVAGRAFIEKLHRQSLPANDTDFLDSYLLGPGDMSAGYAQLLRALPVGLSEWAVHPGCDSDELRAIDPGGYHRRQADFDFLTSPAAKATIREEGIVLISYRALQAVWRQT